MIEVEVQQRVAAALLLRRDHRAAQARFEGAPVGQPGQRIVVGLVREFIGEALGGGDVAEGDHRTERAALFVHDARHVAVDQHHVAIAAAQHREVPTRIRRQRIDAVALLVDDAHDIAERTLEGFAFGPAGQVRRHRVEQRHLAFQVDDDDGVGNRAQRGVRESALLPARGQLALGQAQRVVRRVLRRSQLFFHGVGGSGGCRSSESRGANAKVR